MSFRRRHRHFLHLSCLTCRRNRNGTKNENRRFLLKVFRCSFFSTDNVKGVFCVDEKNVLLWRRLILRSFYGCWVFFFTFPLSYLFFLSFCRIENEVSSNLEFVYTHRNRKLWLRSVVQPNLFLSTLAYVYLYLSSPSFGFCSFFKFIWALCLLFLSVCFAQQEYPKIEVALTQQSSTAKKDLEFFSLQIPSGISTSAGFTAQGGTT
jgi:hypothetical protein